ncbi:MAG: hypothetical protein VX794_05695 [Nitrospinota bacterium]|nr:hypothetical protein [Nitrospinota bacterium]
MENNDNTFKLPVEKSKNRRLIGHLVLWSILFNIVFAVLGGFLLSGPFSYMTRFKFGILLWFGILFFGSLLLAFPIIGLLVLKISRKT